MTGFWASSLADEISQGDLLTGAWVGALSHPPTALKKTATGKGGVAVYTEQNVLTPEQDGRAPFVARGQQIAALVLSWSCEMDKKGGKVPVLVAPVKALDLLPAANQELVREGRRHAFLHLPPVGTIPESYCDLRAITYLPRPFVDQLGRAASVTPEGATLIARQIIMFMARIDLDDIKAA